MEEIKGKDAIRCLPCGLPSGGIEVGNAVLVLDDDLTINDGRLAGELGGRLDHPPISPVQLMTGEGPGIAALDDNQGAVAVMLDLVNPSLPEGGSGTSIGISGLIKPTGAGKRLDICRLCGCSA